MSELYPATTRPDQLWRITGVNVREPAGLRCHVSAPRLHQSGAGYVVTVHAWLLPLTADLDIRGASYHLFEQGPLPLRRLPPAPPDAALLERYPGVHAAGARVLRFHVNLLGEPADFSIAVRVDLGGTATPLFTIRGRKEAWPHLHRPERQPFSVSSLGRTGTTWLMRLLAGHPDLLTVPAYPYEYRYGLYWTHMLSLLAGAGEVDWRDRRYDGGLYANFFYEMHPFGLAAVHDRIPDGEDLRQWLFQDYVEDLVAFTKQNVARFYDHVAATTGKPAARYFVEKVRLGHVTRLFQDIYAAPRQVILIRDPRDMYCSIRAFNRRRGTPGFGAARFTDDRDWLRQLAAEMSRLLAAQQASAGAVHLLRYEALISRPEAELTALLAYAGLDHDETVIQALLAAAAAPEPALAEHQTSPSPARSIGRWRSEMAPKLRAFCQKELGEQLAALGYEPA